MPHMSKGVYRRASHDPNIRDSPNNSIVENLAQTPCAMSYLEVLQSCTSQGNDLLSSLGNPYYLNGHVVKFDV